MYPTKERIRSSGKQDVSPDIEEVFAEVAAPLRAYLRRSTNAHEADDLVQEALTRFLESDRIGSLGLQASRKYIFRIASNLLRDRWRMQSRFQPFEDQKEAVQMDSADRTRSMDLKIDVDRALDRLTERERAMIWLAHAEEYTHREIASTLGLRAGSVRVLLFRARKKLAASIRSQPNKMEETRKQ